MSQRVLIPPLLPDDCHSLKVLLLEAVNRGLNTCYFTDNIKILRVTHIHIYIHFSIDIHLCVPVYILCTHIHMYCIYTVFERGLISSAVLCH